MFKPTQAQSADELKKCCTLSGTSALTPDTLQVHGADAHWMVQDGKAVLARCSLWWTQTPPAPGQRLGLIGHYAAAEPAAGRALLNHACAQLAERDCTLAVGPMDGNTWRSYRLVTDPGVEPPFFLEPHHPPDWPEHFTACGFEELASYYSALNADLAQDPRLEALRQSVAGHGIAVRPLDPARFEDDLNRIYEVSIESFPENFLYSPIAREEFLGMYLPLKPYVQPELILLAERDGQALGYAFSIPDMRQAQRQEKIDTVIIKTVAVRPEAGGMGLGSCLAAESHRAAQTLGFRRAIHALIYEDNISGKISAHTATPMRRYALFSKAL